MTNTHNDETIKNLIEMLIKTSSSSAIMLEKMEQFKASYSLISEIKTSIEYINKKLDKLPDNILTNKELGSALSEVFNVLRDVQTKVHVVDVETHNAISELLKEITKMQTDINSKTCPIEKNLYDMTNSIGGICAIVSEFKNEMSELKKTLADLNITIHSKITTPKYVWYIVGALLVITLMAWVPDLAVWFSKAILGVK